MTDGVTKIWRDVLQVLRKCLGQIFLTHLTYVACGFIIFTPLAGIVGRLLLRLSRHTALSDQDIAYFLLSPSGMVALVIFSAMLITIIAFEQASMMAIIAGTVHGLHIGTMQALSFTAGYAGPIFTFSVRLVMRVLVIILPFLTAGAAVAWLLITDYDINYYLTEKPPIFLAAAAAIGLILLVMAIILLYKLFSWSLTLPLILFAEVPPAGSFRESEKQIQGEKLFLFKVLGSWLLAALLLVLIVMGGIQLLGSKLAPPFYDSLNILVFVLGGLVVLWSFGNLLLTTLTSGSFAGILMNFYERNGLKVNTGCLEDKRQGELWHISTGRFAILLAGTAVVAILIGTWFMSGIQTQDNVEIIAHRGAAGKAPENTLASIRQALEDKTDWVEIDVQESSDGKVVVIHDSDFMKLAGVDMKVWDGTLKQLQEIDIGSWFSPEFSNERVPTLAKVLEEAKGRARVMIELKYYGKNQNLEQRVVDLVEQADMVDNVSIMSLKYEGIQKIQKIRPDWIYGLLAAKAIGNLAGLDVNFLAVNMGMATSGFIRSAHQKGKMVYVWTVDDRVSMSRMMSMCVDGIITNEPEMARQVLAERAGMSSFERLLIHTSVVLGRPTPQKTYRDESP